MIVTVAIILSLVSVNALVTMNVSKLPVSIVVTKVSVDVNGISV